MLTMLKPLLTRVLNRPESVLLIFESDSDLL